MKASATQSSLEKFHTDELLRFWRGQQEFASKTYEGRKWLKETLTMWEANSKSGSMQRSYAAAVRQIKGEINDSNRNAA